MNKETSSNSNLASSNNAQSNTTTSGSGSDPVPSFIPLSGGSNTSNPSFTHIPLDAHKTLHSETLLQGKSSPGPSKRQSDDSNSQTSSISYKRTSSSSLDANEHDMDDSKDSHEFLNTNTKDACDKCPIKSNASLHSCAESFKAKFRALSESSRIYINKYPPLAAFLFTLLILSVIPVSLYIVFSAISFCMVLMIACVGFFVIEGLVLLVGLMFLIFVLSIITLCTCFGFGALFCMWLAYRGGLCLLNKLNRASVMDNSSQANSANDKTYLTTIHRVPTSSSSTTTSLTSERPEHFSVRKDTQFST